MSDTQAEADRLLWYEHLDSPLTVCDAASLTDRLGFNISALGDPDEWVLGHRFVGAPALEAATVLYLTRRSGEPGVRFDLRTTAATPPDTAELHELVKQYIREFTPVSEVWRQQSGGSSGDQPATAYTRRFVVVDYRAQQAALGSQDVALARAARIASRLDFEVPEFAAVGLSGNAHLDLLFPADGPPELTVAVGLSEPMDEDRVQRLRVRAEIGDQSVKRPFSSAGIATIKTLDTDPRTDLLHLTFEVTP